MLSVNKFRPAQKIRFAGFPSMIGVKKSLALRDHRIVMTCRATDRQGSPSGQASRNGARKLPCADSRSLVETSREACRPVRRPLRYQADPSVVIGTREIKEVVVLSEEHFVSWFAADGNQPGPRLRAGGVRINGFLKFHTRFASFAC